MQFRYAPPAGEEWRAFFIQIAGSIFAGLVCAWWQALQHQFNLALTAGLIVGVLFLLFRSALELQNKSRRARLNSVELRPQEFVLREGETETVVSWSAVQRCEPSGTRVQVTWQNAGKERTWSFAPREVLDGQTLAREMKQRSTPNFIALEAK